MPRLSYGLQPRRRAKRLLEALLNYANSELENCEHLKIQVNWQTEKRLVVRTKLRFLEELIALDPDGIQLTRIQIQEAIHRLKDLDILEDNRSVTKGSEDWHFTLKLWYRQYDQKANLERFESEWEHLRSTSSKQLPSTEFSKNQPDGLPSKITSVSPTAATVVEVPPHSSKSKLVVLKLGDDSFEQGFTVTLQIGKKVKILAILGNSTEINIQPEQLLLEQL